MCIYNIIEIKLYHCGDNGPSKSHWLSNQTCSARHGKPPFQVLVRIVRETPRTTEAIFIASSFLPKTES